MLYVGTGEGVIIYYGYDAKPDNRKRIKKVTISL